MTQGTVASAISAYREGLVVLRDLETECGFWFVPMPPEDLEALWLAQNTADAQQDERPSREKKKKKKYYMCFICCDADSYLKRPDGTILLSRCSPGEGQPHPRVKLPRP